MNWNFSEVDKKERLGKVHFCSWYCLEVGVREALQKISIFISYQIRLQAIILENCESWGKMKFTL